MNENDMKDGNSPAPAEGLGPCTRHGGRLRRRAVLRPVEDTTARGRSAAQQKPLTLGLTMDASGQYAASGGEERLGAMMAIREFNDKGGVLGRRIEALHIDTETTPATGSRVAERMITRNEVAFLIGAVHSGVANAISQVAQKYGVVYLNTNSSSPTEAGQNCHRTKFVWDGNGTNFAHAIVKNAIKVNGKNWLLVTNDYVWGHDTNKATRAARRGQRRQDHRRDPRAAEHARLHVLPAAPAADEARRGRRRGRRRRPQGDAHPGGAAKMHQRMAWINNQQDWPDVYGLGPEAIFGVFGTNWY